MPRDGGMREDGVGKFLIGLIAGIAMAFGYVRWNVSPGIMELPEKLRGNIVSTAIEGDLYDLDKPLDARRRALQACFRSGISLDGLIESDVDLLERLQITYEAHRCVIFSFPLPQRLLPASHRLLRHPIRSIARRRPQRLK
jgi:hypothetical protein